MGRRSRVSCDERLGWFWKLDVGMHRNGNLLVCVAVAEQAEAVGAEGRVVGRIDCPAGNYREWYFQEARRRCSC